MEWMANVGSASERQSLRYRHLPSAISHLSFPISHLPSPIPNLPSPIHHDLIPSHPIPSQPHPNPSDLSLHLVHASPSHLSIIHYFITHSSSSYINTTTTTTCHLPHTFVTTLSPPTPRASTYRLCPHARHARTHARVHTQIHTDPHRAECWSKMEWMANVGSASHSFVEFPFFHPRSTKDTKQLTAVLLWKLELVIVMVPPLL